MAVLLAAILTGACVALFGLILEYFLMERRKRRRREETTPRPPDTRRVRLSQESDSNRGRPTVSLIAPNSEATTVPTVHIPVVPPPRAPHDSVLETPPPTYEDAIHLPPVKPSH